MTARVEQIATKSVRIVCIGDVMVDVHARLPGPLAHGSDTPARIVLSPGGSAANTACWLAAVGARATMVGRVGDDLAGRGAVAGLVDAGVDARIAIDPAAATGMCIVLVGPDGERTMIPDTGANAGLDVEDVPAALIRAGAAVHVSAYTLLRPATRPVALAALRLAAESGCGLSVDAASAAPLAAAPGGAVLSWLPAGTTLFANADEAAVLTGLSDPVEAARALAAAGLTAVVKAGSDGAYACAPGSTGVVHSPARQVDLVDSTGAGDAFAAGYLAARLGGATLEAALASGTDLAARAVGLVGARPDTRSVSRGPAGA
ncbi:MAG: PfkB domain protein [Jatrophihabitantaceae bacterium]|nr:PfkB domain protein [Jatrophihabitantaceae bacterium]